MTWKRVQEISIFIMVGVVILVGIWTIYEYETKDLPICDWCGETYTGKQSQVREFWVHDLCFSKLNFEAGKIFDKQGIETWNQDRSQWIYQQIKQRQNYLLEDYEKDN